MGRAKHTTDAQREEMARLKKLGHSVNWISKLLQVSRKRVQNAFKKLRSSKFEQKRGRPRKTSATTDRWIIRESKKDQFLTATRLREMIVRGTGTSLSASTVKRRLRAANLNGRVANKKPLVSNKNRMKRIAFCRAHGSAAEFPWQNVLFSDESKYCRLSSDGKVYVRRPPNQQNNPKYTIKTVKHGGGNVLVWGCFSSRGVGPIHRISGIMNGEKYKEIMKDVMLPYARCVMPPQWVFQHDNDPKHTARIVKKFLQDESVNVMFWPAQSPDLNPIENLWENVNRRIRREKCSRLDNLWEQIEKAWYETPVVECEKLVNSMNRRCASVLKNKGFSTKY